MINHIYLLIILSACSASTFTLGKMLFEYAPPIFLIGLRMVGSGICFLAYYAYYNHHRQSINFKDWWLFAQNCFVSFYLSFVFEFLSLQYLSSAKTAFLYNLSPFIAALFSYVFFDEKMTLRKALGLIIGLLGFLPILMAYTPNEEEIFLFLSWPEIGMFAAVVCYTYGWIVIRKLIKKKRYPVSFVNGIGMLGGGILAFITSYMFELAAFKPASPLVFSWLPITAILPVIGLMGLLILFGNLISYTLYCYFLKKYTATFVTFADFSGPLFAALYGWILLGEKVTWHFFLSAVIVFSGVYLFYQEEQRQGYLEE